jgi:hypothetical protein
MKSLVQDVPLKADGKLSPLVTTVDPAVRAAFDPSAEGVWVRREEPSGRVLLGLRVTNSAGGEATATYTPDELDNPYYLAKRLERQRAAVDRVTEWKGRLGELFHSVRAWSQTLPGGPAVVTETALTLNEELSGEYTVSQLVLRRGHDEMRVVPVALWVLGADGRVDLRGPGGPFTLVDFPTGWQYVGERFPPMTLEPLTESLFHQLALACLDA